MLNDDKVSWGAGFLQNYCPQKSSVPKLSIVPQLFGWPPEFVALKWGVRYLVTCKILHLPGPQMGTNLASGKKYRLSRGSCRLWLLMYFQTAFMTSMRVPRRSPVMLWSVGESRWGRCSPGKCLVGFFAGQGIVQVGDTENLTFLKYFLKNTVCCPYRKFILIFII